MKPKMMNTQSGSDVIAALYRPSKSSQKHSKSANIGQRGYAKGKVTQTSSRIIDLKIVDVNEENEKF